MRSPFLAAATALLLLVSAAAAQETAPARKNLSPLDDLGSRMLWSAFGWPLAFHVAGGAATYGLSMNGNDLTVARFAARQDQALFGPLFLPGMAAGTFFPVLVPGWLWFFHDEGETKNAGAVAIQATAIAFLYNNILKAATGRAHPDEEKNSRALSRDCKWGFGRRGVFYGWPSGHSMTNSALALSIASYRRDDPAIVAGCSLYAGYVATSMVLGAKGHAHWFSDAVAGTLMGASIGWSVGSAFRRAERGEADSSRVSLHPLLLGDAQGALLAARF